MADWIITDSFEISLQKPAKFELLNLEMKSALVISSVGKKDQVLVFCKGKNVEFEYMHYEYIRDMFKELKDAT